MHVKEQFDMLSKDVDFLEGHPSHLPIRHMKDEL